MRSGTPIDIRQVCRWAIGARAASLVSSSRSSPLTFLPAAALAQAVYGSIGGTVKDPAAPCCPASPSRSPASSARPPTPSSPTSRATSCKERLLPGTYEVKAELPGFKTAVVPAITVGVDAQTPVTFTLAIGAVAEEVDGHRRIAAPEEPTAPTSRRGSTPSSSPNCRCSIATSPSSSC